MCFICSWTVSTLAQAVEYSAIYWKVVARLLALSLKT